MVKRKKLNHLLSVVSTPHFPYRTGRRFRMKHRVMLGIGGNVGDVLRRFEHLFFYLQHSPFVSIVESSPMVKNPPFGFLAQEDFHNALLVIETNLTPRALLRYVLRVERVFGRKRLFKDGPRTLDIDLIFYDDITMKSTRLTLPHPGWMERSSVLIPLSYMSGKGGDFRQK